MGMRAALSPVRIPGMDRRVRGEETGWGGGYPCPRHHADAGAAMAEYAILLAFIALVVLSAVTSFGEAVLGLFRSALGALPF